MKGERGCLVGTDVVCFACASLMNMPVCTFSLAHFAFLLADLTSYFSLSLSNAYLLFPFPLKHNKKEWWVQDRASKPCTTTHGNTAIQPSSVVDTDASKQTHATHSFLLPDCIWGGGTIKTNNRHLASRSTPRLLRPSTPWRSSTPSPTPSSASATIWRRLSFRRPPTLAHTMSSSLSSPAWVFFSPLCKQSIKQAKGDSKCDLCFPPFEQSPLVEISKQWKR